MDHLLDELNTSLSTMLGMNREDISISILGRRDSDKKWHWWSFVNISSLPKAKDIAENDKSSAKQVVDGKTKFLFIADKKTGQSKNQYIIGDKDKTTQATGSIICRDISVAFEDQKYITAILNITTYGKQVCEIGSEDSIKPALETLLSAYEARIKLELALYYIESHYNESKQVAS